VSAYWVGADSARCDPRHAAVLRFEVALREKCAARVGLPVLFDVVTDAAAFFAQVCASVSAASNAAALTTPTPVAAATTTATTAATTTTSSPAAPAATSTSAALTTASTSTSTVATPAALFVPAALASDGVFLLEQAARYRSLAFVFAWRAELWPAPEDDALFYDDVRDAATAALVSALQRRVRTHTALALAWVGAADDVSTHAPLSERESDVAMRVLARGRTFVRRLLSMFAWQPSGVLVSESV
jgi:hypothetical protein